MNKINKFNNYFSRFHPLFIKLRYLTPVLFFVVLLLILANASSIFGKSLVASVETPVIINYDGKTKSYLATQNTIGGALEQTGLPLGQFDITEPATETLLNGQKQTIKVIRALPVLISDNNQERLAYSAYTDESAILAQLKIVLYPEDKVGVSLITDPADENAVGQKVTIERAPVYTIKVDGGEQIIRSWGKTIGEVLNGKISLGQRDIIAPIVTLPSFGIQEITVTRINVAEVTETITLPFLTENRRDYTLYSGQVKTLNEGENGQRQQLVRVTYQNGLEVSREIISSENTKSVVNKVVSLGVKPYQAGMWWETLVKAGETWGVDPASLYNVMICESGGNPYSGGYYQGLFQYQPETWAGVSKAYPGGAYQGSLITDGAAQIYVTAWKVAKSGWGAWGCQP